MIEITLRTAADSVSLRVRVNDKLVAGGMAESFDRCYEVAKEALGYARVHGQDWEVLDESGGSNDV